MNAGWVGLDEEWLREAAVDMGEARFKDQLLRLLEAMDIRQMPSLKSKLERVPNGRVVGGLLTGLVSEQLPSSQNTESVSHCVE